MKVMVNQETCIGCGMCIDVCPELFRINDDDKSECDLDKIPPELESKVIEACDVCPVDAIETEDDFGIIPPESEN